MEKIGQNLPEITASFSQDQGNFASTVIFRGVMMSMLDIDNDQSVTTDWQQADTTVPPIVLDHLKPRGFVRRSGTDLHRVRPMVRPGATGRGLLSAAQVRSGYIPRNPTLDAVLNRGAALVLLIAVAPIFMAVWLVLRLSSMAPVFYRGARLGKDGQIFHILKFRTLHMGTQRKLTSKTLPKRTQMETRIGSYLRQSRIDELPQLINILRGDMVFFGPRPIRPEMLPIYQVEAPGFEARFAVRPGLIGYAQALMPHSATKRLRGRFNAMCCAAPIRYGHVALFCAAVGLSVLRKTFGIVFQLIGALTSPLGRHVFLRSGFAHQKGATIEIGADGTGSGALVSLSDEILQFVTTLPVALGPTQVEIARKRRDGRMVRLTLNAEVKAVMPVGLGQSGFAGYAQITALTKYQQFRLERYFLGQTVLPV